MSTSDNSNLREQVAQINPGDTVTVLLGLGVSGTVPTAPEIVTQDDGGWLMLGPMILRVPVGGDPGPYIAAVLSHEPAPKPRVTVEELDALPTYAVVDDGDDGLWPKHGNGKWGVTGTRSSANLLDDYPDLTIASYGALPKPGADQ